MVLKRAKCLQTALKRQFFRGNVENRLAAVRLRFQILFYVPSKKGSTLRIPSSMARRRGFSALGSTLMHRIWTELFSAFSSHQPPPAFLTKGIPHVFFFIVLVFGNVWSLWDGSGSSIESWKHFFKHPQLLRVMIVVPADSLQRTRYRVLSAGEFWLCKHL